MNATGAHPAPVDPSPPPPNPPPVIDDAGLSPLLPLRAGVLWGLLAALYTCYLAAGLIVPLLLACFVALLGNPLVAFAQKWHVPRWLGALILLIGGLATTTYAASWLVEPALHWLQRAPMEMREHLPKLRELFAPLQEARQATRSLQNMAESGPAPPPVQVQEPASTTILTWLSTAPALATTVLAILILAYFLMVYGERLLQQLVSVMPSWGQKRATVELLRTLQADLSRYVITVSLINMGLGTAVGLAVWLLGFPADSAVLWGVITALLNFAPYVGPLFTTIGLTLAALTTFPDLHQVLLVPVAHLSINLVESQLVTPLILGQRMAISPVTLVLWLFLWGWLWGIAGVLLAVPMLVCIKIICNRLESLQGWARLMEP